MSRLLRSHFLLFLFLLVGHGYVLAAQDDISVKVEVDKAFATIGDEINFRVTAVHPPEMSLLEINAESALTDFEIKKTTDFSTREGNVVTEGKNYLMTSYSLGEYVIHPFAVKYRAKDGSVKEIQTNSLYLTLESVDKNKKPESDIRGVKGVQKIKSRAVRWILGLALTGTVITFCVWFYLRQRKKVLEAGKNEPPLSPQEEAYLALNQLKNSDLIRKGLVKQYFFQMSEILRRYIERRFRIKALESTTYELIQDLVPLVTKEQMELVQDMLTFCDLVKFAKYEPPALEIIEQTNRAKMVVDKTIPEPEPVLENSVKAF